MNWYQQHQFIIQQQHQQNQQQQSFISTFTQQDVFQRSPFLTNNNQNQSQQQLSFTNNNNASSITTTMEEQERLELLTNSTNNGEFNVNSSQRSKSPSTLLLNVNSSTNSSGVSKTNTLKRRLSEANFQKDTEMYSTNSTNADSSAPNSPVCEVARQIKRMRFQCMINVKLLNGRLIQLDVDSSQTVESIKQLLFQSEGIPIEQQRLLFNGKQLVSGSLELSDLHNDATIFLLLALPSKSGFTGISAAHRKDWKPEDDLKNKQFYQQQHNPTPNSVISTNNSIANANGLNGMNGFNGIMLKSTSSSGSNNNNINVNNSVNSLVDENNNNKQQTSVFSISNKKQRIINNNNNNPISRNDVVQYSSSPNVQMTEQN